MMDAQLYYYTKSLWTVHSKWVNKIICELYLSNTDFNINFIANVVVQSLGHVQLFATPWTIGRQASLSFIISQCLLKLMSTESVMPSNHLVLCHSLLLLPLIFPSIMANRWVKRMTDFTFLSSKITADGNCSHEIKRCLLFRRKTMTSLDSILKSRDITLSTKFHMFKAMVSPVVLYRCGNWTIKKTECWRTDAFKL